MTALDGILLMTEPKREELNLRAALLARMLGETYTCWRCGIQSTPDVRLRFVGEIECWACYLIACRERRESIALAAKIVAEQPASRGRDVLLRYLGA